MGVRASSPSTAVRVSVVRGGGLAAGGGGADGEPPDDVDTLSAGSLKAATANDCGAKYILHEEWLADVCGVSRRRWVLIHLIRTRFRHRVLDLILGKLFTPV